MNEIKNSGIVALVTPMHEDGSLNLSTYKKILTSISKKIARELLQLVQQGNHQL